MSEARLLPPSSTAEAASETFFVDEALLDDVEKAMVWLMLLFKEESKERVGATSESAADKRILRGAIEVNEGGE